MSNLAARLEDLPGVASVVVDLDDAESGGIRVRLEPDADEAEVMERVRALLVAYGVRSASSRLRVGRATFAGEGDIGVDVRITPVKGGARIEVIGSTVRSFRIAPPNPSAIAQALADAWCQVLGRIPVEIVRVGRGDDGGVVVVASNGTIESMGRAGLEAGWEMAIARAVGEAAGLVKSPGALEESRLASTAW